MTTSRNSPFWKPVVPVQISGLWPAVAGRKESGAKVLVLEREGGPVLLEGRANFEGDFRGTLATKWCRKTVIVAVLIPGFRPSQFTEIKVEKWGLFLVVQLEKDLAYNGRHGAQQEDAVKWRKWSPEGEHAAATEKINAAIRRAKIAWPVQPLGLVVAIGCGIGGFYMSPFAGFILGVVSFVLMEALAQFLLNRGY